MGHVRGYRLATNQPPGGGVQLIEMLNVLEQFDLVSLGHNSPEYIRIVAEAMKIATADRKDAKVGDPRFVDVPLDELTSKRSRPARPTPSNGASTPPWPASTPAAPTPPTPPRCPRSTSTATA